MKQNSFLCILKMKKLLILLAVLLMAIRINAQSISYVKSLMDQGKYREAAQQLRPLADGGNAEAQCLAAQMFFEGKGVAKNDAQGVRYATLAADQGNEEAIMLLAKHYYSVGDNNKMFSILQHYTNKHPYLMKKEIGASLAKCYLYGLGTTIDKEKAWSIILNENSHADEFKKECAEEWKAYQEKHPEEYKEFDVVEQMPQFPGGQSALFKWLSENIQPTHGGYGRLILSFVVKRDGSISEVKVASNRDNISEATCNDAITTLRKMPKWIPGKQNGKTVNVRYSIPITYRRSNK